MKNRFIVFVVAAITALNGAIPLKDAFASSLAEIYVSPVGNDESGTGSIENPLKTVTAAQKKITQYRNSGKYSEIKVILREGEYPPISVSSLNGGNSIVKISYESYKNEKAVISEAAKLDPGGFKNIDGNSRLYERIPPKARANVMEFDLQSAGITGVVPPSELGDAAIDAPCEPGLFIDDTVFQTARWPNEGYINLSEYAGAEEPVDSGEGLYTTKLINIEGTDNSKWLEAENAYIAGYITYEYFFKRAGITEIEPGSLTINGKIRDNANVFFCNIPEELDSPSEWYYSPEDNKIYVYPEKDIENSDIRFVYKGKKLISGSANNVSFSNFELNGSYETAVGLSGKNITVKNCVIKNGCCQAVEIQGENNRIEGNHIYNMGMGGIHETPDWEKHWNNMKTFTSGGNIITNNNIHDFNCVQRAYAPAVYSYGVGSVVSHNTIHGASGSALTVCGVGQICEYNEIYDVISEVGDAGAIYIGGAWLNRGHEIKYNKIYGCTLSGYASGIFLDDCSSANFIYANVIDGFSSAVKIHGGTDNVIQNNVFTFAGEDNGVKESGLCVVRKNGVEQWKDQQAPTVGSYKEELYEYAKTPAWQERWPGLDSFFERDEYKYPSNTVVRDNIFAGYSYDEMITGSAVTDYWNWGCEIENNIVYEDASEFYADFDDRDFRYKFSGGSDMEFSFGKSGADKYYRRYMRDVIGENYNFETELTVEKFPDIISDEYRGTTFEVYNKAYKMEFSIEKNGIYILNAKRERELLKEIKITPGELHKYGVKVRKNKAELYLDGVLQGEFELPVLDAQKGDSAADDIKIRYKVSAGDDISFVMKSLKLDKVYPGCAVIADFFDNEYSGPGAREMSEVSVLNVSERDDLRQKDGIYSAECMLLANDNAGSVTYNLPENCYIADISCVYTANPKQSNIRYYASEGNDGERYIFSAPSGGFFLTPVYGNDLFRYTVSANESGKSVMEENKFRSIKISIEQSNEDSVYKVPGILLAAIVYKGEGIDENTEGSYNIYSTDFNYNEMGRFGYEFKSSVLENFAKPYVTLLQEGVRFKNTPDFENIEKLQVEDMGLYAAEGIDLDTDTNYSLKSVEGVLYRVYDEGDCFKVKFYCEENEEFTAVLAGYNNGKLVRTDAEKIDKDSVLMISKDGATEVKLFIWNDFQRGMPLEPAVLKVINK